MSIKNQSRLPIFALIIIGATVFSLVGLNYLVEKIAKTRPPEMAQSKPPPALRNMNGQDDAVAPLVPPGKLGGDLRPPAPNGFDLKKGMMPPPGMKGPEGNGGGVMRRMRKGANGEAGGDRAYPNGNNGGGAGNGGQNGGPNGKAPPRDLKERPNQPPPPPVPDQNYRPSDQELYEIEMERRRMMGPPPGYAPPEYYQDGPPPYGEEDYEYFDDYDYDSKLEDPNQEDIKTTASDTNEYQDEPNNDLDLVVEDEYLNEFLDEEDED